MTSPLTPEERERLTKSRLALSSRRIMRIGAAIRKLTGLDKHLTLSHGLRDFILNPPPDKEDTEDHYDLFDNPEGQRGLADIILNPPPDGASIVTEANKEKDDGVSKET